MGSRTGLPLKILSVSLKRFRYISGAMFCGRKEVSHVEIAGVCIHKERNFARILDFCGEVLVEMEDQEIHLSSSYLLTCKIHIRNGVIGLRCKSARKIGIFEEMFFWAEAVNLRKTLQCNRNRH
ncbi:hypothetical protein EHEL_031060 [Encephalitozoon hellem ATCC 50504]|uniref:Replication protein A n=1 Tax=Encephalitozoon hellem TaxID=27973 RepID=A0A9Q9C2D1_ENCHE|nr:uncharacterized protein EHEL_031060 [Encephalitozoon hellem ATCC 50504]AFM98002.1 hypothetical protein EHEL_031060 [Encephalitozoon hellem ATCC 50504]UTX42806.1 replication protein A [Encephalitozoon hellem]|eukprot:XP_003886983.1 hypothetical protein EHEL_031060 [Encephalitozoon hellem ATCC 50504]